MEDERALDSANMEDALANCVLTSSLGARELALLGGTNHALAALAARPDLWQHLLLKDFPSSAALPAAAYAAAGSSFREFYLKRRLTVPRQKPSQLPLPPPSLSVDQLVLLVELRCSWWNDDLFLAHSVQGAELERLLTTGRVEFKAPEGPWLKDLGYPELSHGNKGEWDPISDGERRIWEQFKPTAQLVRLTDLKVCCLIDANSTLKSDPAAQGDIDYQAEDGPGWVQNTIWGAKNSRKDGRPFPSDPEALRLLEEDREAALFEGTSFPLREVKLPFNADYAHAGKLHALLREADVNDVGFEILPTLKLPHSPRYFAYDAITNGWGVHGKMKVKKRASFLYQKFQEGWDGLSDEQADEAMAASDAMEEQCPKLHSVELRFWAEAKTWSGPYHNGPGEATVAGRQEPAVSLLQLIDALVWE